MLRNLFFYLFRVLLVFNLAEKLYYTTQLFPLLNMLIVHRYRVKIYRKEQETRAWVSQCGKFSHDGFRDQEARRRAGIKKIEGRVRRRNIYLWTRVACVQGKQHLRDTCRRSKNTGLF